MPVVEHEENDAGESQIDKTSFEEHFLFADVPGVSTYGVGWVNE